MIIIIITLLLLLLLFIIIITIIIIIHIYIYISCNIYVCLSEYYIVTNLRIWIDRLYDWYVHSYIADIAPELQIWSIFHFTQG